VTFSFSGFIRGCPDESAAVINFKPKFAGGSLLTIVSQCLLYPLLVTFVYLF